DRIEKLSRRNLSIALAIPELAEIGGVAPCQREDIGRRANAEFLVIIERLDLLLAEAIDIESPERHEVLQMFLALERAGEFARAAAHDALAAARRLVTHHRCLQFTWANRGKLEFFGIAGTAFRHVAQNLRDHVAGALHDHRITDAHA